ncbi:prostaglandin reductase 1-like [Artemia franciscana]|uniref:prostaglandin reductase 1-like n=1 Tax=Artemia franciscana TaxID=6661 RepID=UPI0032DA4D50
MSALSIVMKRNAVAILLKRSNLLQKLPPSYVLDQRHIKITSSYNEKEEFPKVKSELRDIDMKTKQFIFVRHFVGEPKLEDFELVEEELPPLKDKEILCEALYLSVDPYMRPYSRDRQPGTTMIGSQVAKVIESKHSDYPVGELLVGYFGWRLHTIKNPDVQATGMFDAIFKLPNLGGLSPSVGLGAVGMPGNTAYFGFLEICQPKPGETVVVNGAAGAVGSLVGQIAKIKGCKVIGYAGSDDKIKWLQELGFDHAFNYKKVNIRKSLKEAAPNGVDCYFDNVGGLFSSEVLNHMNTFGRVSVCGAISVYNDDPKNPTLVPAVQPAMVFKELKMEGFLVSRWVNRWQEGLKQMSQWIQEGKIKYEETETFGFENTPKAFIGMLRGENTGKAVVKV